MNRGRPTLIIVRRSLAELNALFVGAMVEASLARFMASMAAFNRERALSRSFGRWDLVAIGESQGGCEEAVRRAGHEEESES